MDAQQAKDLLQRYLSGNATNEEIQLIERWYGKMVENGEWQWNEGEKESLLASMETRLLQSIQQKTIPITKTYSIKKIVWWAAASIIILLGTGSYFLFSPKNKIQPQPIVKNEPPQKSNILPGGNKAVLTLANGETIILDSAANGVLAQQSGADIIKTENGKLAYKTSGENPTEIIYNTLSTPRGGQYQLTLPDGTLVWLNAASSIKYPTAFTGKERTIETTGEAYFEVAKNAAMPFRINVNQQAMIEVLGTHFNVNTYSNEPVMKTTLLEGSVRFYSHNNTQQKVTLQPGQQSQLDVSSQKLVVKSNVETDKVIAWKNGLFDFNDANLQEVMNQLERWYDIEVVYKKGIPPIRFFGKMTKNISLNDMLVILEKSKVHFTIEGRKLIVQP